MWRLPALAGADDDRDADAAPSGWVGSMQQTSTAMDSGGRGGRIHRRKMLRPVLGLVGHSNALSGAAWMGPAGLIATASWDHSAQVYDVASGGSKALRTLAGHDGALTVVAAASSSSVVLTGSRDCTARLWDARFKMPLLHVFQGHSNTVTSVLFSNDDAVALTASEDRTVKVWDLRSWDSPLVTLRCARTGVLNMSLSSRKGLLAAVLDNATTRVYSMEGSKRGVLSHKAVPTLPAPDKLLSSFVTCSVWSPDEACIYSGGFDASSILVWQVLPRVCLSTAATPSHACACAPPCNSPQLLAAASEVLCLRCRACNERGMMRRVPCAQAPSGQRHDDLVGLPQATLSFGSPP